jgi:ankyrin repeat protein
MDNIKTPPPYFTIPEILRFISRALDTKNTNKTLDEACRHIDTNYRLIDNLIDDLIEKPITKSSGSKAGKLLSAFTNRIIVKYMEVVREVSLDGISRELSIDFLAKNYFCHALADLLDVISKQIGGPNPVVLLESDRQSIDVLFSWFSGQFPWFNEYLKNCPKDEKNKFNNWIKGKELPSATSILAMNTWAINKSSIQQDYGTNDEWQIIRLLLLTCRSIDFLKSFDIGKDCISKTKQSLLIPHKQFQIGKQAHQLQIEHNKKYHDYVGIFFQTWSLLRKDQAKTKQSQESVLANLGLAKKQRKKIDPDGKFDYWQHWLNARYAIFIDDPKAANKYYKKAFNEALYRVGPAQKELINEALATAAIQGKNGDQAFLKKLKSMAVLLGISLPNALSKDESSRYSSTEIMDKYEIACLRKEFSNIFPPFSYFTPPIAPIKESRAGGIPIIEKPSDFKLNIDRPNSNFKITGNDGRIKKMPQIVYFSMWNKNNEVRALLKAGADVNRLSTDGESALLFALNSLDRTQVENPSMNSKLLDMILENDHSIETLNKSTLKIKLLPLISAVKTGDYNIVKNLLNKGTAADTRGETDGQTALNVCLKLIGREVNPKFSKEQTLLHQFSDASIESAKRYAGGMLGNTNEQVKQTLIKHGNNPQFNKFTQQYFNDVANSWGKQFNVDELRKIAQLLLDFGADPNLEFSAPVKGYTALMLTAESDEIELFKYMLEKSGDPNKTYYCHTTNMHVDCLRISEYFKANDVHKYLLEAE